MKKLFLSVVVILMVVVVKAQIENPVKWAYSAKKVATGVYELHMTATLQPKWHIYSQDISGDGPVPTAFVFDKNPLVKTDGTVKEVGKLEKQFDKNFNMVLKFYGNKVDFVQKVKLKTPVSTLTKGKVTFMVCNDQKCLPPKDVSFSIKIDPKS